VVQVPALIQDRHPPWTTTADAGRATTVAVDGTHPTRQLHVHAGHGPLARHQMAGVIAGQRRSSIPKIVD
jgi:hypothetical protein